MKLPITGAAVRTHEMRWGEHLLAVIANPNLAIQSKFMICVEGNQADFVFRTLPSFFFILYQPYCCGRARLEKIAQDIPRAAAQWLGELFSKLSSEQLADAFYAAHHR